MTSFKIVSLNISEKKGTVKRPVSSIEMKEDYGIVGDAHAGKGHRQVSLLALEDIEEMRKIKPSIQIGDFAENITTSGIQLYTLPLGTRFTIGECVLELTQIGKTCHTGCEIFEKVGSCIMPKRGVFTKVIQGGIITKESSASYKKG